MLGYILSDNGVNSLIVDVITFAGATSNLRDDAISTSVPYPTKLSSVSLASIFDFSQDVTRDEPIVDITKFPSASIFESV